MTVFNDQITLLDRTQSNRTLSSDIPNGDLTPWRIRLEMTNTGQTGVDNSGRLTLRIDEPKTFIKTGPLLLREDAKTKYLIEVKISQDIEGASTTGKIFRFMLGTPSLDTDENNGAILSMTLQEIQYRMRESITARELRFVSPNQALMQRVLDHNNHQGNTGVNIAINGTSNLLPLAPELEYVPQAPVSIKSSIDNIFENLSEPSVLGGVFNDFYYDFDPSSTLTLSTTLTAKEIGQEDTGIILDPLSAEIVDSEQEQSASTDFFRFKNQVTFRGSPNGGTLPTEHSIFESNWEHAKQRSYFSNSRTVDDRYGNTKKYLKGEVCKRSFSTNASGNAPYVVVTRFFQALTDIETSNTATPEVNTDWFEDFITVPEFDKTGHYEEGDIVYFLNSSNAYEFYRANDYIYDWSLGRFREWDGGNNAFEFHARAGNTTSHLDNSTGFLKEPDESNSGWSSIALDLPTRSNNATNFEGFKGFSPWTQSVFDWEKNMVGLNGSLPYGTGNTHDGGNNRYVGFVPDWNLCKDDYAKQDALDEFESISVKWIDKISNSPPATAEIYHGQRILVGTSGSGDFNNQDDKLAQYDKNISGWQFSRTPVRGDTVVNFDDGRVYQHSGTAWEIAWEVEKTVDGRNSTDRGNPISPASPFHLVKDVYKTQGFEGTPNSAVEFRYLLDTEDSTNIPLPTDDKNRKSKLARLNSRGAWLWFWFPFPRKAHGDNGSVAIGENYGGNGSSSSYATGFTTLNVNNLSSDRKQSTKGWNNGLDSEDMGKIQSINFKLKVGIYAAHVQPYNDDAFWELPEQTLVMGMEKVPLVFWCVDMFDRIWYKTFTLRKNGNWDEVSIQVGDMSESNLYLPRWDELTNFLGIPLSSTKFALKQREYSGVAFDWRFVRGWGIQYMAGYDDTGFYNGGIDTWWDVLEQGAQHVANTPYNLGLKIYNALTNIGNPDPETAAPAAYATHRQATIAIDDLHFKKELMVNSNDTTVPNARTHFENGGSVHDYITAKQLAKGKQARLSFFPQFWHIRAIGDVRMRVGEAFNLKGDRIPEHPDLYSAWSAGTYAKDDKVKHGGYTYMSKVDGNTDTPTDDIEGKWENLNRLSCAEVKHIIDHTGYHMEVTARRKFRITGE